MPVPPRRCRFVRVARIGRRRLGRSERLGLAEETDRPQLALRAVAQREVLLPKQAYERVDERHSLEVLAHVSWLAHVAHDLGAALPADLSHDVRKGCSLGMHRDPISVVCDDARRLPGGERSGREHHRGNYEHSAAGCAGHDSKPYDAASRAGKRVLRVAIRSPWVARCAAL